MGRKGSLQKVDGFLQEREERVQSMKNVIKNKNEQFFILNLFWGTKKKEAWESILQSALDISKCDKNFFKIVTKFVSKCVM